MDESPRTVALGVNTFAKAGPVFALSRSEILPKLYARLLIQDRISVKRPVINTDAEDSLGDQHPSIHPLGWQKKNTTTSLNEAGFTDVYRGYGILIKLCLTWRISYADRVTSF